MEKFFIVGGNKLEGELRVDSAKNSLLPLLACSIMVEGEVCLKDAVRYSDVLAMCRILEHLGAKTKWENDDLLLDCRNISHEDVSNDLASCLRASIFVLGPLLSRLGKAKVAYPGGCDIGLRPIDLHLNAIRDLGAKVVEKNGYIYASRQAMQAKEVVLPFASVGATENIMMLALSIPGQTRIVNPAREPEIIDLQNFINNAGGDVKGAGSNLIVINGGKKLHGLSYKPIADRIEAGTYMIATAMCGGRVALKGAKVSDNAELVAKLLKTSCQISQESDSIIVSSSGKLRSFGEIETAVYPGFPTDLQAQMTALASVAEGYSLIVENIFDGRNKHISQLKKMGANLISRKGITVATGREKLYGADVRATDLRGGASLILAGLVAEGYTTINDIHLVDRGYFKIEEKLGSIGAIIKRIDCEKEKTDCLD